MHLNALCLSDRAHALECSKVPPSTIASPVKDSQVDGDVAWNPGTQLGLECGGLKAEVVYQILLFQFTPTLMLTCLQGTHATNQLAANAYACLLSSKCPCGFSESWDVSVGLQSVISWANDLRNLFYSSLILGHHKNTRDDAEQRYLWLFALHKSPDKHNNYHKRCGAPSKHRSFSFSHLTGLSHYPRQGWPKLFWKSDAKSRWHVPILSSVHTDGIINRYLAGGSH